MKLRIIRLDLWYMTKSDERRVRKNEEKGIYGRKDALKTIRIKPSGDSITELKLDLAHALKSLLRRLQYYYVVGVFRKSNNDTTYRVIVPKVNLG
jgi:hypothetical protein